MTKIGDHEIYIGTKEETMEAKNKGMSIVCALNRAPAAPGIFTHQSVVGWTGQGCPKDHPNYLYKVFKNGIFLNMIDGDNPAYVSDTMINAALAFMKIQLDAGDKVFVYCSMGMSRSPSIVLMYLLENELLQASSKTFEEFRKLYPDYYPGRGNLEYIKNRYDI